MLRKLTHTDEPLRLPLLADSATVEAQFQHARECVAKDLDKEPSESFASEILRLVKATVGDSQALHALKGMEMAAETLIEKQVRPKQIMRALKNLRDTMSKHESREALAYVRSQLAMQRYRETSDTSDLLVPEPQDASFITVRALTSDERRAAERRAGQKPKHGALLASRAFDVMRRESREGGDGNSAYTEFLSSLTIEEQTQVQDFEEWSVNVEREVCRAGIIAIDGFDIVREGGFYNVSQFLEQCLEGDEVISEASRHIRNIASLGKSESLPQSSQSGTDGREGGAPASEMAGSAPNASTADDSSQSRES